MSEQMERALKEASNKGLIIPRTEKNPYLKYSYKGAGTSISDKWNVKVYTTGSVVCNDPQVLHDLMSGNFKEPDRSLRTIQFDDAGWGFPLCGIMIGMTNGEDIWTDTVDVSFFQSPKFGKKLYLQEYCNKGLDLFFKLPLISPKLYRVEICTGFVNSILRETLRSMGYDVRVTEIQGLLQDELEDHFKTYISQETRGSIQAYDPKEIQKKEISAAYYQAVKWGKKYAKHMLKSGWESMKEGL